MRSNARVRSTAFGKGYYYSAVVFASNICTCVSASIRLCIVSGYRYVLCIHECGWMDRWLWVWLHVFFSKSVEFKRDIHTIYRIQYIHIEHLSSTYTIKENAAHKIYMITQYSGISFFLLWSLHHLPVRSKTLQPRTPAPGRRFHARNPSTD